FFVSIYKSDVETYYYTILIGASIIYNLVFMLLTFLASEGVKNYKRGYSWVLFTLGALQIVRIFILPTTMHATVIGEPVTHMFTFQFQRALEEEQSLVMGDWQFTRVCVYLIASALCLICAALVNLIKSSALSAHLARLEMKRA
ncbi:MAG: hypothetical protein IJ662_10490, partial [Clostridia bacterium]|nr:hypothetical protein [Clostridia bacterium]